MNLSGSKGQVESEARRVRRCVGGEWGGGNRKKRYFCVGPLLAADKVETDPVSSVA